MSDDWGGKCISCGKHGFYQHNSGGYVCEDCVGLYFTCPDCGIVFNQNDFKEGDTGIGFCRNCSEEH